MWRTALRPRWLLLLAVVLLAATGMARLGQWQLDRAHENSRAAQTERVSRPPVPLTSLFAPRSAFPAAGDERPVTVTGRWDGAAQLLVPGRLQNGAPGYWVLTPLRLADGSGVGVVRGWTADPAAPAARVAALPAGQVDVEGVLRPGEPPADRAPGAGSGLPAGQIDRIDPAELVHRWDFPLYTGYVVARSLSPAAPGPGLAGVPVISESGGLSLQNLSYALQWWLFAAFGMFLWWRLVRDDHRGLLRRDPAARAPGPIGDDGGDREQASAVRGASP